MLYLFRLRACIRIRPLAVAPPKPKSQFALAKCAINQPSQTIMDLVAFAQQQERSLIGDGLLAGLSVSEFEARLSSICLNVRRILAAKREAILSHPPPAKRSPHRPQAPIVADPAISPANASQRSHHAQAGANGEDLFGDDMPLPVGLSQEAPPPPANPSTKPHTSAHLQPPPTNNGEDLFGGDMVLPVGMSQGASSSLANASIKSAPTTSTNAPAGNGDDLFGDDLQLPVGLSQEASALSANSTTNPPANLSKPPPTKGSKAVQVQVGPSACSHLPVSSINLFLSPNNLHCHPTTSFVNLSLSPNNHPTTEPTTTFVAHINCALCFPVFCLFLFAFGSCCVCACVASLWLLFAACAGRLKCTPASAPAVTIASSGGQLGSGRERLALLHTPMVFCCDCPCLLLVLVAYASACSGRSTKCTPVAAPAAEFVSHTGQR